MNQDDSSEVEYPKNIHDDMVHSSGLRGYLEVMQQLGVDPMPLLIKHGIQLAQLQDDNAWISHTALIQLLRRKCATGQLCRFRFADLPVSRYWHFRCTWADLTKCIDTS
jgi:hypothetical protein